MNLLDHHVTEVLTDSEEVKCDWGSYWKKQVMVNCYGHVSETTVTSPTKEGIDAYIPGFVYQA